MSVEPESVADLVRSSMDLLSPAERRVGRVLLADYPSVGLRTVAGLAERAGVSGPSVLRFSKRLGFESFPAMQDRLRDELSSRGGGPAERFVHLSDHGTTADLVRSSVAVIAESAQASVEAIPAHELDAAVDLLSDAARSVYLTGGRSSAVIAARFAELLAWNRPRVTHLPDPWHRGRGALLDVRRRDVYVILDIRRYEQDMVDLAAHLRRQEAAVIVVTDEWLSPAAQHADVVLSVSGRSASPFESLAGMTMLVEALIVPISARIGASVHDRMRAWESLDRDQKLEP